MGKALDAQAPRAGDDVAKGCRNVGVAVRLASRARNGRGVADTPHAEESIRWGNAPRGVNEVGWRRWEWRRGDSDDHIPVGEWGTRDARVCARDEVHILQGGARLRHGVHDEDVDRRVVQAHHLLSALPPESSVDDMLGSAQVNGFGVGSDTNAVSAYIERLWSAGDVRAHPIGEHGVCECGEEWARGWAPGENAVDLGVSCTAHVYDARSTRGVIDVAPRAFGDEAPYKDPAPVPRNEHLSCEQRKDAST